MANANVELPLLAKRLKAAGQVGIRREMVKALKLAAVPLVPDIQESAREMLPRRGGMNAYMAAKRPKVSVRTSVRSAGVSIRYTGKGAYSDTARWRHPVFANGNQTRAQWKWVEQTYSPAKDWFEKGAEKATPAAKREMDAVLTSVAAQVRGLGL